MNAIGSSASIVGARTSPASALASFRAAEEDGNALKSERAVELGVSIVRAERAAEAAQRRAESASATGLIAFLVAVILVGCIAVNACNFLIGWSSCHLDHLDSACSALTQH